LDIGINVESVSSVEMFLGDNKGNRIILQRGRYLSQEVLITPAVSRIVRDLVIEFVKIRDTHIVKLSSHDTYMYVKPSTILFLFELEHCIINYVYFELCQKTFHK